MPATTAPPTPTATQQANGPADLSLVYVDTRVPGTVPLFVAKYFMAPGHWKVNKVTEGEKLIEGRTEAMAVGEAPAEVIDMAVRAANLIGRGLYGVDLKQAEDRIYLIEVNCNPNIDAGNEDQVLGDALYREVVGVFARRIAERGNGIRRVPPS